MGTLCARGKELHDRFEVYVGPACIVVDDLLLAVRDELFVLCFGDECHLV